MKNTMIVINPYLSIDVKDFIEFLVTSLDTDPDKYQLWGLRKDNAGRFSISEGTEQEMIDLHKQILERTSLTIMMENFVRRADR